MRRTAVRRLTAAAAGTVALTALIAAGTLTPAGAAGGRPADKPAGPKPVEVQLLALNDFHGNLEPPGGSGGRIGDVAAGGVEYLDTNLDQLSAQAKKKNTITVAAADLIGASRCCSLHSTTNRPSRH